MGILKGILNGDFVWIFYMGFLYGNFKGVFCMGILVGILGGVSVRVFERGLLYGYFPWGLKWGI